MMLEALMTTEFLSLIGGSLTGFIFRSLAEKRQDEIRYAPLDLFGLFGKNTYISFESINGYLFTQENRQILVAIVGFYFGNASAKAK